MAGINGWLSPLRGHITGQTLADSTPWEFHAVRFVRRWDGPDPAVLWIGGAEELHPLLEDGQVPAGTAFFSAGGTASLLDLAQKRQVSLVTTDLDLFALSDVLSAALRRRQEWSFRLLEAAGQRHNVQDVVEAGAKLAGGALFLLNAGRKVIYASGSACPDSAPVRELVEQGRLREPSARVLMSGDPGQTGEAYCYAMGSEGRCWVQRVYKNQSLISYMLLFVPCGNWDLDAATLLELVRENVSRAAAAEGGGYWAGADFKALMADLLSGRLTDEQEICRRFSLISRRPQQFCTFIVLEPGAPHGPLVASTALLAQLESIFPESNAAVYDDGIVLLLSCPDRDFQPAPVFDRERFQDLLARYDAYAAISNATSRRAMLRTNYILTKSVLHLGRALRSSTTQRVFFFEDYAEYVMIDLCINSFSALLGHDDIIYLTHPDAVKLYRYDLRHHTNLLDVLYYYCLNNCSISQAAKAAYMHRNTFSAHLAKLQELIRADLDNGEIQQRMVFSYKILRYYDRYAKINLGKRLSVSAPDERKE